MSTLDKMAISVLWNLQFDPYLDDRNTGGSIEFSFDGSAASYLKWREHFINKGSRRAATS
jgi:hypothetical protein